MKALAPTTRLQEILALRFGAIRRFIASQDAAYWAMLFYLFIEYVRPQQLYNPLAALPWGKISLGMAAAAYLAAGRLLKTRSGVNGLLLLYSAIVIVSSLQGYDLDAARERWWLYFTWVIIYFMLINVVRTEERFAVFMMSWLLWNFYMSQGAAKQWIGRGFSFANWGVVGAPGWFANSGEFGIEMCLFLPVSWHFYVAARPYLSKWKKLLMLSLPLTAVMGAIASSSRGALLGVASVGLWALLRSKARVKALIGIAVLTVVVVLVTPEEQKRRFTEAGEDSTSTRRLTYWKNGLEMAAEHPVLGIGYGNWLAYYRMNYVPQGVEVNAVFGEAQLPHNIFIECVAELGYVGLTVLVMLIVATFVVNHRTRKMARAGPDPSDFMVQMAYGLDGALVGFMASGFFVTVLYYPYFWINLALTVALHEAARVRVARARAAAQAAARGPAGGTAGWRRR